MNQLNNSIFSFKEGSSDIDTIKCLPEEILKKSDKILVHGKNGDFLRRKPNRNSTNPRSVAELHEQEEQRHALSEKGAGFSRKDRENFEREDRQ